MMRKSKDAKRLTCLTTATGYEAKKRDRLKRKNENLRVLKRKSIEKALDFQELKHEIDWMIQK